MRPGGGGAGPIAHCTCMVGCGMAGLTRCGDARTYWEGCSWKACRRGGGYVWGKGELVFDHHRPNNARHLDAHVCRKDQPKTKRGIHRNNSSAPCNPLGRIKRGLGWSCPATPSPEGRSLGRGRDCAAAAAGAGGEQRIGAPGAGGRAQGNWPFGICLRPGGGDRGNPPPKKIFIPRFQYPPKL